MEARLYRKTSKGVVCQLCWRFCKLENGEDGYCRVRYVKNWKLYTRTYGRLSYLESRPVEIKPFYHFLPGSTSMTFSGYSCNLDCPWCQNWTISKSTVKDHFVPAEKLVEFALKAGDCSTCGSLNEPTLLFEYILDVFRLAKERGLLNTMVSNGYMTILALRELKKAGLDAINIDMKGGERTYEMIGGEREYVWRTIKEAVKLGLHVEIVCLLVTGVSDDLPTIRENVERLANLNPEIPIHFTRYFPAYKFDSPPTSIETIDEAVKVARRELFYVYTGNIPRVENTYCPDCGELLLSRYHVGVLKNRLQEGCCPKCGREIYGVWTTQPSRD